ncbi:hypothetical protein HDV00_011648 [Rhizophlyctis rosea]|nr:hypothetical protein HDV00_011648 [Rhizophlyctis rosea]
MVNMKLWQGAALLSMAAQIAAQAVAAKVLGVVLFTGFQLLDIAGPLDYFNNLSYRTPGGVPLKIVTISETGNLTGTYIARHPTLLPNGSTGFMDMEAGGFQGETWYANYSYATVPKVDYILIPGGMGSRLELNNPVMMEFLKKQAEEVEYFLTVCTGSTLAARAGVLDGRRATSNKAAWSYVTSRNVSEPGVVQWVPKARWVVDGKFWTSSGVQAGMDMAHAFVAHIYGETVANTTSTSMEYEPHRDPNWDPFAELYGLANSTTTTTTTPTQTPITVTLPPVTITATPVTITATPVTITAAPVTITTTTTTTTTKTATCPPPPTPCAKKYEQCGGTGNFHGPKCCDAGLKCLKYSESYSQCVGF